MAGKIQKQDVKTEAELVAAGATKADLINDTQIYVSASGINKSLDDAIIDGDLSGGGGGTSAVEKNFIAMDTSFATTKITNSTAVTSVGDWIAYADAAGVSAVDGTGGSPNTTITRTTTAGEFLGGAAGFKMTISSGASRQGEGVSCTANIPKKARGQIVRFTAPFVTSGTIALDDIRLNCYDVTNSALVTVISGNKLTGASGVFNGFFKVPATCTQVRVIIHIARSTTGALDIFFDDVEVELENSPIINNVLYTPTLTGFGTPSGEKAWFTIQGDMMYLRSTFTSGTNTGTEARLSLPSGFTSSTDFMDTSLELVGEMQQNISGTSVPIINVLCEPTKTYVTFGYKDTTTGLTKLLGNQLASSCKDSLFCTIPIVWN